MTTRQTPPESGKPVLTVRNLNKSFPGVHALRDVSLDVHKQEVVGLVGENGAGKSTLMRVLAGVYPADSGEVQVNGKAVTFHSPREAAQNGVGMVFQEQSLLPNLTVGENIFLGNEDSFMRYGLIDWGRLNAAARQQLEKVRSTVSPSRRTSELSFAERQMVELAKVMTLEERVESNLVILLDEPTSVLEQAEIDILFERIRLLRERASFIFVSHRLDEVLAVSDRVYVMKDGQVVAMKPTADVSAHELHRLMVGRGVQAEYYRESEQAPYSEEVALEVKDLAYESYFKDVSFQLRKGEVMGIAGVVGSGREELCRLLFGFHAPTAGQMLLESKPVHFKIPSDAASAGIGYVPRERRTEGLVLYLSVASNITLSSLGQVLRNKLISYVRERELAMQWVDKLSIKTPSIKTMCLNLSGGNQQKVVLAKWINARVKVLILDHPTRGLDVGAKEEVYTLIRQLSSQGIAIVLTADTLEETIGLSHNILVMRDGTITKRFTANAGQKPDQLALIEYMV